MPGSYKREKFMENKSKTGEKLRILSGLFMVIAGEISMDMVKEEGHLEAGVLVFYSKGPAV